MADSHLKRLSALGATSLRPSACFHASMYRWRSCRRRRVGKIRSAILAIRMEFQYSQGVHKDEFHCIIAVEQISFHTANPNGLFRRSGLIPNRMRAPPYAVFSCPHQLARNRTLSFAFPAPLNRHADKSGVKFVVFQSASRMDFRYKSLLKSYRRETFGFIASCGVNPLMQHES